LKYGQERILKKLFKDVQLWSSMTPGEFLYYELFLKAELKRIDGDLINAEKYYDQAIEEATKVMLSKLFFHFKFPILSNKAIIFSFPLPQ